MVLLGGHANSYISGVAKTEFIAFRVAPELKRELQRIADDEQRALSQVCEMFLYEGVEDSKKEGPKFIDLATGGARAGLGLLCEMTQNVPLRALAKTALMRGPPVALTPGTVDSVPAGLRQLNALPGNEE
jgi:hypothetical protein